MGHIRTYLAERKWYQALSGTKYALLTLISPALNTKACWKQAYHRGLELSDPVLLSDKQAWLKLNIYNKSHLVKRLADKTLVREYAKQNGFEGNLLEVYRIWDSIDDIDVAGIPAPFVLKASLGCGGHVFCRKASDFNREKARASLRRACSPMNWLRYGEMQYKPDRYVKQRFFAERMLDVPEGRSPDDFKFHCYEGEPRHITYCYDRAADGHPQLLRLNMNWEADPLLSAANHKDTEVPPKPACFEEMKHIAQTLAAPFPFVRVDFYVEHGKPILGEMTFTPAGCLQADYPGDTERKLGDLIHLDHIDRKRLELE